MKEIFNFILTYKIGLKYRRLLYLSLFLLIGFHIFVMVIPFYSSETSPFPHIKSFQKASDSLSNITASLIALLIIFEGQNGLRYYYLNSRKVTYHSIRENILAWLHKTRPLAFDAADSMAQFIYGDKAEEIQVLQHLKVSGAPDHLMAIYDYPVHYRDKVIQYSHAIHFEFTRYPTELLYGIHVELDDYTISLKLAETLAERLNLAKQTGDLVIDNCTPKQAGWIFMTRTIHLSGDIDKDYPQVMTHARHFVELVCHSYDVLYSKAMIDFYLQLPNSSPDSLLA